MDRLDPGQGGAAVEAVDPDWAYRDAISLMSMEIGPLRALLARHLSAVEIDPAPTVGRNAKDLTRVTLHWLDGTSERLENGVPVVDSSADTNR